MSLAILRYGDPEHDPKDRIVDNGILYYLDMIVYSPSAAIMRKTQLEQVREDVQITERLAPPEESRNFMPQDGFSLGGKSIPVYEVWYVAPRQRPARMKRSKPAASFGALHPSRKPSKKGSFGAKKKPIKKTTVKRRK